MLDGVPRHMQKKAEVILGSSDQKAVASFILANIDKQDSFWESEAALTKADRARDRFTVHSAVRALSEEQLQMGAQAHFDASEVEHAAERLGLTTRSTLSSSTLGLGVSGVGGGAGTGTSTRIGNSAEASAAARSRFAKLRTYIRASATLATATKEKLQPTHFDDAADAITEQPELRAKLDEKQLELVSSMRLSNTATGPLPGWLASLGKGDVVVANLSDSVGADTVRACSFCRGSLLPYRLWAYARRLHAG